jgi:hypothetical protein
MMFRQSCIGEAAGVQVLRNEPAYNARILPKALQRIAIALCAAFTVTVAAGAAPLDKPVAVQGQAQQEAVRSQDKIDKIADQTADLATRYKSVLAELDNLRAYDDQVDKLVSSQQQQAQSLERQLRDIDVTEQQILPFIERMLATLDEFVKLDVPFLPDERQRRLEHLHAMMDDASVPIAEKYRRVMEAYQIETDYGRNIEAYRGKLTLDGGERLVDFLRIGRVVLLYRTLDGSDTGYWDRDQRRWVSMGESDSRAVAKGLRIARKETAPDLIEAPVPAPEAGHE